MSILRSALLTGLVALLAVHPVLTQWVKTNSPWIGTINSLAASGTNLFAGCRGVFLSTNNGTSWTAVDSGLTDSSVQSLAVSGTNLFAGTYYGGVFLSTNNGASWTAVNSGLAHAPVYSFAVSGINLFAGTWNGGVCLSTNNGTSWTAVNSGLANLIVRSLTVSGTNLFAGTDSGVFLSTNNGTTWATVDSGLTNPYVQSFAVSGTNLFAGTFGGSIFLSTNNGTSWTAVDSGFSHAPVYSLAVSGTNLFAGTWYNGVWRRPLSEMIASVIFLPDQIPSGFRLAQNFPNPFNPSTTIQFGLLSASYVTLKIYNILGQEVATLLNEKRDAGQHSIQWNARGLPSGVYFYCLYAHPTGAKQTSDFVQTKKLLLLK